MKLNFSIGERMVFQVNVVWCFFSSFLRVGLPIEWYVPRCTVFLLLYSDWYLISGSASYHHMKQDFNQVCSLTKHGNNRHSTLLEIRFYLQLLWLFKPSFPEMSLLYTKPPPAEYSQTFHTTIIIVSSLVFTSKIWSEYSTQDFFC